MDAYWKVCFGLVLMTVSAYGLGCMSRICAGNEKNKVLECRGPDQACGHFKGRRRDHKHIEGIDLICPVDEYVFAPFDGEISYHLPFGGQEDQKCADQGVQIQGTGQWRGYYAFISSVKLHKYGGKVKKGEKLGRAGNIECALENSQQSNQNYLRVEIFREGVAIDPTNYLSDCMCTGQICETNWKNQLLKEPFRNEPSLYNGVKGWEIHCPLAEEEDDYEDKIITRPPLVYSPIDGEIIGRKRLNFDNSMYAGCENDGIFITGTGDWIGFEVTIYNARYRPEIGFGKKRIAQHQPIGYRLNCTSHTPNSVFMEVRFEGNQVNITDAITGKNCKLPDFRHLF